MQIQTSITINAKPQYVWDVLTDFDNYPSWNPFIKMIKGVLSKGYQIDVAIQNMKFKPVVIEFAKNEEFRWKGKLAIKGIFDGEHYFILQANEDGTTTFIHGELFTGLLVPLFRKKLTTETKEAFIAMNHALKDTCESTN